MNQETYAMRMENNVDDKLIILDFIDDREDQGYNILDFGCGSGSIFRDIYNSYPNTTLIGFDKSDFMITRAKQNYPQGLFYSKYEQLDTLVKEKGAFEYIILNSLLHEIYSYEDGFNSVVELLQKLSKYLSHTGKFIVRDGILDTNSIQSLDQIEKYGLRNPQEAKLFLKKYTGLSPFSNSLKIKNDMIVGVWHEVREFLNKYTWGFESLYREAKEIVNFATLETYRKLFSRAGFNIKDEQLITQEEYFRYLDKIVEIKDRRWNTKIVFSASKDF